MRESPYPATLSPYRPAAGRAISLTEDEVVHVANADGQRRVAQAPEEKHHTRGDRAIRRPFLGQRVSAPTVADPDVLVVGAGPVGLLLACELARRDVAVRVVDKLPGPTDESRAIVVRARSLEMLERVGVVEEVLSTGVRMTGAQFHLDGRTEARIPLDTVDSPYPFSLTLPQTDTERILTQRLRSLGVEVDRGVEFVGFEQNDAGVDHLASRRRPGRGRQVRPRGGHRREPQHGPSRLRHQARGDVQGRAIPARRRGG